MTGVTVKVTSNRVWTFAVASTLCIAMVAFCSALLNHSAAAANIAASRDVKMFSAVKGPPIERLRSQLLATPLEPNLLHAFIAHRVHVRGATVLSNTERAAVKSLGWQSTIAQIDLILDGLARKDEASVLTRIDGMLRRGKQTSGLINILVQIEQNGSDARGKLVTMLQSKPNWRDEFFRSQFGTATKAATIARSATLDAMFARSLAPSRNEVAPVVNALVAIEENVRAQSLWQNFYKTGPRTPLPFDPNFSSLAGIPFDGPYPPMVYEWQPGEGPGYSVRASSVGENNALLRVRWDGRGAPILLQQKLITPAGRFSIVVTGSLLSQRAIQRVSFVFFCKGSPTVFNDRVSQGPNGEFTFAANDAVGCENPDLRLVGNSEEETNAIDLELTSIRVVRQTSSG